MKILAIDTATEACSAALFIDASSYHQFEVCPQQHSQKLLPMVDALLKQQDLSIGQLDLLAFGRGPGSFTGVRIATGLIQGFALGGELKVAAVSTLAMMAQQAIQQHQANRIAVAIDARMDEVYFAIFHNQNGLAVCEHPEQVISPQAASELMRDSECDHLAGTGWAAYPALAAFQAELGEVRVLYPSCEFILALVKQAIDEDKLVTAEAVEPVYVRDKVTWKKLPGRA